MVRAQALLARPAAVQLHGDERAGRTDPLLAPRVAHERCVSPPPLPPSAHTPLTRAVWCCDKLYERCPPNIEGVQCIPLYYENPALRGPAWSPSTGAKNTGDSPDTVQDTEANSSEESPDTVQDTGWTPRPAAQGPAGPTGPGVNTFVALGVGVLVGMGLVAGVGFWLWARRERRKKVRAERAAVVT